MELNILQDVNIADEHCWVGNWKLKAGEVRKVPKHVADRLINRGQAELTEAEAIIQESSSKEHLKGRRSGRSVSAKKTDSTQAKKTDKKSSIPDAIKSKIGL